MPPGVPKPRLRKVYILPNLITAANMFLGLLAIYCVLDEAQGGLQDRLELACWAIFAGGILDMFDGVVARMTHTESDFGMQFDSLSDLVTFGVAPSVAAFYLMKDIGVEHQRVIIGVCSLFCICSALRLARYNVQVKGPERKGFLGLPTPASALAVAFFILLVRKYELNTSDALLFNFGTSKVILGKLVVSLMPLLVLALSILMVSEVPYPKISQQLRMKRRMGFDTLVMIIVFFLFVAALKSNLRVVTGFLVIYAYLLFGITSYLMNLSRKPMNGAETTSDPGTPPETR